MPRVTINKKQYLKKDFCSWIAGKMFRKYTQKDVGRALGISQQAFSRKLKNCEFTFDDVITLLDFFKATDEERIRLLKL